MTTYDNYRHSPLIFPPCPESSHHKDRNRYWDRCKGQAELRVTYVDHYNNYELDGETKEEEEVEFQKGDIDL